MCRDGRSEDASESRGMRSQSLGLPGTFRQKCLKMPVDTRSYGLSLAESNYWFCPYDGTESPRRCAPIQSFDSRPNRRWCAPLSAHDDTPAPTAPFVRWRFLAALLPTQMVCRTGRCLSLLVWHLVFVGDQVVVGARDRRAAGWPRSTHHVRP